VCNTKTAGMIDSGDNVITNASGNNSVSTEPVMVQNRRMRLGAIVIFAAVLSISSAMQAAGFARADATADVLAQEARWLRAITDGDRPAIESILAANYRHITRDGVLLDRDQEIEMTEPLQVTMTPSEQLVDIVGDTALIHGVNTVTDASAVVVERVRFTDVFIAKGGAWLAISAQETSI
jgi:Domain of unknown function (DUF4440)